MTELAKKIAQQTGLKVIEVTTRQDNIPFYRGDLRKSVVNHSFRITESGTDVLVTVGTNIPYGRAVHDGRRAVVIRPRRAKILCWWTNPEKSRSLIPFPHGRAFNDAVKTGQIRVSRRVYQPARPANPFFIRAVGMLQHEGFGFLSPILKQHTATEIEEMVRFFR